MDGAAPTTAADTSGMPRVGGLLWNELTSYHLNDVFALWEFGPLGVEGHHAPFEEAAMNTDYLVRSPTGLIDPNDEAFRALSAWRARRAQARRALSPER